MALHQDLRIIHLFERPEAASTLQQWFINEWAPWYGPKGPGDAESDLAACRSRDKLPICLIALSRDSDLVGTAALRTESVGSEHGIGPWLAAVLVGKGYERRGIATALVEAIEQEAFRLGFRSIYTSTESAKSIMERRGWQVFGTSESLRGCVTIYQKQLGDDPGMKRSG
jgi:GNAT superfamily N-acetyltransferase